MAKNEGTGIHPDLESIKAADKEATERKEQARKGIEADQALLKKAREEYTESRSQAAKLHEGSYSGKKAAAGITSGALILTLAFNVIGVASAFFPFIFILGAVAAIAGAIYAGKSLAEAGDKTVAYTKAEDEFAKAKHAIKKSSELPEQVKALADQATREQLGISEETPPLTKAQKSAAAKAGAFKIRSSLTTPSNLAPLDLDDKKIAKILNNTGYSMLTDDKKTGVEEAFVSAIYNMSTTKQNIQYPVLEALGYQLALSPNSGIKDPNFIKNAQNAQSKIDATNHLNAQGYAKDILQEWDAQQQPQQQQIKELQQQNINLQGQLDDIAKENTLIRNELYQAQHPRTFSQADEQVIPAGEIQSTLDPLASSQLQTYEHFNEASLAAATAEAVGVGVGVEAGAGAAGPKQPTTTGDKTLDVMIQPGGIEGELTKEPTTATAQPAAPVAEKGSHYDILRGDPNKKPDAEPTQSDWHSELTATREGPTTKLNIDDDRTKNREPNNEPGKSAADDTPKETGTTKIIPGWGSAPEQTEVKAPPPSPSTTEKPADISSGVDRS